MTLNGPPAEDIETVAVKARRIILYIQVGEGILIALAVITIVILTSVVISDHHIVHVQQAKIAAQQTRITTQQHRLEALTSGLQDEQHRVDSALCDSQFTIATAPVTDVASKLGVEFVESSRKAFAVLQCPGRLGPIPKALIILGHRYGVPIRY